MKKWGNDLSSLLGETIARKMATKTFRRFLVVYIVSMFFAIWAVTTSGVGQRTLKALFFDASADYPYAYVPCEVSFNLDDQTFLELRILIPCKDKYQEKSLSRMLPLIKNEIITGTGGRMAAHIRQRNMATLKSDLTALVNNKLSHPVETIYFQNLIAFRVWSL
ncbi:MAG: hypothetical protein RBT11_09700 [Desulfobacterales bacterium]|nr:hypothetical protein [Desulfobacterales bacterium]